MHIERIWLYRKRHGFRATVNRVLLSLERIVRGNRLLLFYCDLPCCRTARPNETERSVLERKNSERALDPRDFQQIIDASNPKLRQRQVGERFSQGASLWLFKTEGKLAAYGWTLVGRTVEPHFLPLTPDDVHLFDFFVFPKFRGRRINPLLLHHILGRLAIEHKGRAYIEVAEWNAAQLASLRRTPFRELGCARKFAIVSRTIVVWSHTKPLLLDKQRT